jgi:hypothetical protein
MKAAPMKNFGSVSPDLISFDRGNVTQCVQQQRDVEDPTELTRSSIEIQDKFVDLSTSIGE